MILTVGANVDELPPLVNRGAECVSSSPLGERIEARGNRSRTGCIRLGESPGGEAPSPSHRKRWAPSSPRGERKRCRQLQAIARASAHAGGCTNRHSGL